MTDNVIDTINKQAKEELKGIEYADINVKTTLDDYQGSYDSDSEFKYDDKSYETSDNSTVKGDNDLDDDYDDETDQHDDDHDDPNQQEESQQQHFNVEVSDNDSSDGEEEVGGNQPDNDSLVDTDQQEQHVVENDDSSANEEEAPLHDSVRADYASIESVDTVTNDYDDGGTDAINDDPPVQPEMPKDNQRGNNPVPAAVQKLKDNLNGPHWDRGMINSVLHEHCIGSVIREYNNLESVAVSATQQYGFQKRMKLSRMKNTKLLSENWARTLLGKCNRYASSKLCYVRHDEDVIVILDVFEKKKKAWNWKLGGVPTVDLRGSTLPKLNPVHHV